METKQTIERARRRGRGERARPPCWPARAVSIVAPLVLSALLSGALLSGCGGVDSGGTGATQDHVSVGPITGFGSVVVAGVHHDESMAQIVDDDGRALSAGALQLGTMTMIEGSAVVAAPSGDRLESTATRVRVFEQVVGPVESVDADGLGLTVLGQRVAVVPTTVLDTRLASGLAALQPGDLLAVFGQLDVAAGRIVATRIEPRPLATALVLRAPVTSYSRATRRLVLGGVEIDLAALTDAELPMALPAGTLARATLQPQRTSALWMAVSLRAVSEVPAAGRTVEIEGRISQFTSAQSFSVEGVPVDASAAAFPRGTSGLALGARVEVEGRMVDGTLVARSVEPESDDAPDGGGFEVEGRISALDRAAETFVVRGITVSYAGTPRFEGGTAADLAIDRKVEVKGTLSADRTRLQATRIHIEL